MTKFRVVIPARFASSRFPGKPLVDLCGTPMIRRVVEQALQSDAIEVAVASDDKRILDAVAGLPVEGILTRSEHTSGTDRLMEAAEKRSWRNDEMLVNVQGDEPLIPPQVINQVAALAAHSAPDGVATLSEPIEKRSEIFDPNIVKVVVDRRQMAMYFSRAPVPWDREGFGSGNGVRMRAGYRRHIGIYALRKATLRQFVSLPRGRLESMESLEQLRFLENGVPIVVADAAVSVPRGVDSPEDAERVMELLRSRA